MSRCLCSWPLRHALALASAPLLVPSIAVAAVGGEPARPVSDGPFSIGGTQRTQVEAISGQFRPGRARSDFLLSLRTTLAAEWRTGALLLGGELLDARAYGQADNSSASTSEVNALEPLQGYVGLNLAPLGTAGTIKAGRFTMDLGSSRLVARPDSSNAPTAFTGIIGEVAPAADTRLTAFWTMPNTRLPADAASIRDNVVELDRSSADLQFFGGHGGTRLGERLGVEVFAYRLAERDSARTATRNRNFTTLGARLHRAPKGGEFDFDLDGAVQRGRIRATSAPSDVIDLPVRAGFAHGEAGFKFSQTWSPRVSLHLDYASGDDATSRATYGRFDPLYGSRRSDFGPTSLYGPLTRASLVSAGLRAEAKPGGRTDMFVMHRVNWLAEATDSFAATGVRDPGGRSGRFAGHQLEARVRHWIVADHLRLEAGAAYLAKGRFLDTAPNAPRTGDTRYGYLALNTTF